MMMQSVVLIINHLIMSVDSELKACQLPASHLAAHIDSECARRLIKCQCEEICFPGSEMQYRHHLIAHAEQKMKQLEKKVTELKAQSITPVSHHHAAASASASTAKSVSKPASVSALAAASNNNDASSSVSSGVSHSKQRVIDENKEGVADEANDKLDPCVLTRRIKYAEFSFEYWLAIDPLNNVRIRAFRVEKNKHNWLDLDDFMSLLNSHHIRTHSANKWFERLQAKEGKNTHTALVRLIDRSARPIVDNAKEVEEPKIKVRRRKYLCVNPDGLCRLLNEICESSDSAYVQQLKQQFDIANKHYEIEGAFTEKSIDEVTRSAKSHILNSTHRSTVVSSGSSSSALSHSTVQNRSSSSNAAVSAKPIAASSASARVSSSLAQPPGGLNITHNKHSSNSSRSRYDASNHSSSSIDLPPSMAKQSNSSTSINPSSNSSAVTPAAASHPSISAAAASSCSVELPISSGQHLNNNNVTYNNAVQSSAMEMSDDEVGDEDDEEGDHHQMNGEADMMSEDEDEDDAPISLAAAASKAINRHSM